MKKQPQYNSLEWRRDNNARKSVEEVQKKLLLRAKEENLTPMRFQFVYAPGMLSDLDAVCMIRLCCTDEALAEPINVSYRDDVLKHLKHLSQVQP